MARYGGDEFVVLMPDTDAEGAAGRAQGRGRLARHNATAAGGAPFGQYRHAHCAAADIDDLLREADRRMYTASARAQPPRESPRPTDPPPEHRSTFSSLRVEPHESTRGGKKSRMSYKVGYFVGSLAPGRSTATREGADPGRAPRLEFTEIPIKDLPLYSYDYDADYPPAARALKEAHRGVDACCSSRPSTTARSRAR